MNNNPLESLTRKEERTIAREEQKTLHMKEKKMRTIKKRVLVLGFLMLGVTLIAFFVLTLQDTSPDGKDFSRSMDDEGRVHVSDGADVTYASNPPTSGSHWGVPLTDGIYDEEKPDEAIIHSLEHGRVWISYKPTIPGTTEQALKELAEKNTALILTPRTANDTDIALVAWRRLDTFNLAEDGSFDPGRISDFIERYQFKAPEFIGGNGGGKTY